MAMKQRCYQPNHVGFPRYGGVGIKVWDQWKDDFKAFYADMGPCPTGLTLDRIDSSKDYTPDNCRWATYTEQGQNTSRNRRITFNGETLVLAEWGRRFGISGWLIHDRLRRGWNLEDALTQPADPHRPKSQYRR
jgi:hypothetical protein